MKSNMHDREETEGNTRESSIGPAGGKYVLRLVVAGTSRRSNRAIANLKEICDCYLPGRYELEIIDIYQQPELAEGLQILAVPTLLKQLPPPLRRLVGDLSQADRILLALGLPAEQGVSMAEPAGSALEYAERLSL